MAFYRNASFPFQVHIVENLVLELSPGKSICYLKQTVSQSAFAMVDMSYYTEIPDVVHLNLEK